MTLVTAVMWDAVRGAAWRPAVLPTVKVAAVCAALKDSQKHSSGFVVESNQATVSSTSGVTELAASKFKYVCTARFTAICSGLTDLKHSVRNHVNRAR